MDWYWLGGGRVAVLSVIALLVAPVAALAQSRQMKRPTPVPPGFVGMMMDGPLWPTTMPGVKLAAQLNRMARAGVENVRVTFDWAQVQPYGSWAQLRQAAPSRARAFTNVGGIPTDFHSLDELVRLAARRRMTILPVLIDAPSWDATPAKGLVVGIPARLGPYARFARALVHRYGPHGTFWSADRSIPYAPIRMWQIWNEPDVSVFWPQQPFAASYVRLLAAAHAAIKAADPSAKVVLAGLTGFSWLDLGHIYAIRGARRLFDVVGVHAYTKLPAGVITILTNVRRVMDANGDGRKPMLADEIGWPASLLTPDGVSIRTVTTQAGDARNVNAILPLLGRNRARLKLLGFDYYTWASTDVENTLQSFSFYGLLRYSAGELRTEPALEAFARGALKLEACRKKASVATRCLRPG